MIEEWWLRNDLYKETAKETCFPFLKPHYSLPNDSWIHNDLNNTRRSTGRPEFKTDLLHIQALYVAAPSTLTFS